jgi:hypothetical protein
MLIWLKQSWHAEAGWEPTLYKRYHKLNESLLDDWMTMHNISRYSYEYHQPPKEGTELFLSFNTVEEHFVDILVH